MLNKEDIKRIRKIKGMVRGESIKDNFKVISVIEGKSGIEKLEKRMHDLAFVLDYKNIKNEEWYPLGDDVSVVVLSTEVFGWDREKIKEFGRNVFKLSSIEKVFIKYFVSPKKVFESASEHWSRYYTVGELKAEKFSEKEKYAVLRLNGFNAHENYCSMLIGFFEEVISLTISSSKAWAEEVKCAHKGDNYHDFVIRWQ